MIEFGKANHIAAAATAVAVEQALAGIHQEAGFVISVQRTQPHPSAAAESAGPAANHAPADSPAGESAVSTRREPGDSRTSCLDRQNTAERTQIPGKDGGRPQKVLALSSGPHPAPHAEQAPLCPSAHGGWIGQACRIFAVRRCLLGRITGGDQLPGLLSAMQAVVPDGASQSGKIVKVFRQGRQIPRRTQMRSCCSSWL